MEQSKMRRPKNVSIAVRLIIATLVLGLVGLIYNLFFLAEPSPFYALVLAFAVIFILAITALDIFFIYMIWKGRNWARIVYLVLFLIGVPFSIVSIILLGFVTVSQTILTILGLFQIALDTIAFVLLFRKDSSAWFNQTKPKK